MSDLPENQIDGRFAGHIRLTAYLAAAFFLCGCVLCGCESGSNLSGQLMLEGQPTPGELVFEPLDEKNKLAGQTITVYADEMGSFEVLLPETAESSRIRIVIRATPASAEGVPSSFDSQGPPEKVVTLIRQLPIEGPLVFALTR